MGIVNVTPDSFSDGGRYLDPERALAHGLSLIEAGADILDIGGESTRPGADPVGEDEERRRVIPVIRALRARSEIPISIDTTKAGVAAEALAAGADILNDISALTADPEMIGVARASTVGIILMHRQGTPKTMQVAPAYEDVVRAVCDYLHARLSDVTAAGVDRARLAVDPGIGFGKTVEHNLQLLANLKKLTHLQAPLVVGVSRKSFLGRLTGRNVDERLASSLAALVFCLLNGANVMRVHDVRESVDARRVWEALRQYGEHNDGVPFVWRQ